MKLGGASLEAYYNHKIRKQKYYENLQLRSHGFHDSQGRKRNNKKEMKQKMH